MRSLAIDVLAQTVVMVVAVSLMLRVAGSIEMQQVLKPGTIHRDVERPAALLQDGLDLLIEGKMLRREGHTPLSAIEAEGGVYRRAGRADAVLDVAPLQSFFSSPQLVFRAVVGLECFCALSDCGVVGDGICAAGEGKCLAPHETEA